MVNRSAQAVEGSSGRALRPCNVKRELGGRLELFAKINGAHEVEGAHDAAVFASSMTCASLAASPTPRASSSDPGDA